MKKQSTVVASRLAPETMEQLQHYADKYRISVGMFLRAIAFEFLRNPARFNLP